MQQQAAGINRVMSIFLQKGNAVMRMSMTKVDTSMTTSIAVAIMTIADIAMSMIITITDMIKRMKA